ncbi:MBL fold metallo-hydrolase [Archangium violaceum]|uniref:ComEC/Rec2 family competence protein n=1 Tax=Archangium violaceum TaxID=83451 RepID=UPI00194E4A30|nr:MBL fold metallo-hydrolase [Archangium violaceum]QRO01744.1 MBL fold metallo-hydrolase [Archangium violaceum]
MAELRVVFMDAGQGDSTLVVYPDGSLMLIDCGSTKSKGVVAPEIVNVLNMYLPATPGGNTIKTLVLTHADVDHYNMIQGLVTAGINFQHVLYGGDVADYTVNNTANFLRSHPSVNAICGQDNYSDPPNTPNADLSAPTDGVYVWVLAANHPNTAYADKNTNSVVLLILYQELKVYLMGDATVATEKHIVQHYSLAAFSGVPIPEHPAGATLLDPIGPENRVALKVGHHGSARTSSSQAFIQKILPQILFISSDTRPFGGTGLPNSTTISNIDTWSPLSAFNAHDFVFFEDINRVFTQLNAREGVYTTLYQLHPHQEGGSYHYVIKDDGSVDLQRT